jgi:hypothetical protein
MQWVAKGSPERYFEYRQQTRWPRPLSVFRYLKIVEGFAERQQAIGFKLMLAQARYFPETLPILCLHNYRIIVLNRANVFEACISAYLSKAAGAGHSRVTSNLPTVRVDPSRLVTDMRRRQRNLRRLERWLPMLPVASTSLEYESLCLNPAGECRRLFEFMGVGNEAVLASNLKKRVNKSYWDLILNYSEIERAVVQAGLARHLIGADAFAATAH